MRRKIKCNIYTNATVKKNSRKRFFNLSYYCVSCKGPCKVDYINKADPDTINPNHPGYCAGYSGLSYSKPKLHQIGFGSIAPGKKFVICMRKGKRGSLRTYKDLGVRKKKLQIADELCDDIRYYNDLKYILSIKNN
jgi:hypothetical protein